MSCNGPGSNGSPCQSPGTPLQSYRAPTSGRRRKYGCERGASAATVTAKWRPASVPGATDEAAGSSRSIFHPAGAAIDGFADDGIVEPVDRNPGRGHERVGDQT